MGDGFIHEHPIKPVLEIGEAFTPDIEKEFAVYVSNVMQWFIDLKKK